ncbi:MAG: hypothetical protein KF809_03435 [Chloroflexi bacterium]|nr:hypothetical protein [Chloroflexota bacterium]
MRHRSRGFSVLAASLLLVATLPATGSAQPPDTALNVNLLKNGTFNTKPTDETGPVPRWTNLAGNPTIEKFGTRSWPTKAYGKKYNGGARYITCYGGKGTHTITQTVDVIGRSSNQYQAKFSISYGGVKGHRITVQTEALNAGGTTIKEKTTAKALVITNSYKKSVAAINLQPNTAQVRVTVTLRAKGNGANAACKVMADTAQLVILAR